MTSERDRELVRRAAVHAALGDPGRLAIVDALLLGEASPSELQRLLAMSSNLLAHHVRVLEQVGVVSRHRSEADRRRTYLALVPGALDMLRPMKLHDAVRVVFVCTHNSARSQLAAALWNDTSPVPATSAGTHPAPAVHPGAVAAARRHRIPLTPARPRHVDDVLPTATARTTWSSPSATPRTRNSSQPRRQLDDGRGRLHWSIPDPARTGEATAFDRVVTDLTGRIARVVPAVAPRRPIHPTPEDLMQVDYRRPDLSIDQQLALRTAATNLARAFDGTFGAETIDRFLHSSYDEFAGRAVVLNYLPLLAERFARQRLHALAKVEGKHISGVPVVLFLCTHNAGRSQMALGFFTHLAGDRAIAWSGGSEPATTINPVGDRRDAGTGHRHLRRVPQAVDRRGRPRRRRRRHHGLRRRLPGLPRPPLRGLGSRRPRRPRRRRRPPDPRRDRTPRPPPARRTRDPRPCLTRPLPNTAIEPE